MGAGSRSGNLLLELAKFRHDKPRELRTPFERWLHLLKFGELYQAADPLPGELACEEGIEMAVNRMREASASEQVRELVEMRLKAQRDWASRMEYAEKTGFEKGMKRGVEQGIEQGRLEVARRLLQEGMSRERVLELTGLSAEELDG